MQLLLHSITADVTLALKYNDVLIRVTSNCACRACIFVRAGNQVSEDYFEAQDSNASLTCLVKLMSQCAWIRFRKIQITWEHIVLDVFEWAGTSISEVECVLALTYFVFMICQPLFIPQCAAWGSTSSLQISRFLPVCSQLCYSSLTSALKHMWRSVMWSIHQFGSVGLQGHVPDCSTTFSKPPLPRLNLKLWCEGSD